MNYSKFVPYPHAMAAHAEPDHLLTSVKALTFDYQALCTSEYCNKIGYGVVRLVERSEDLCPICGHYLYWERVVA